MILFVKNVNYILFCPNYVGTLTVVISPIFPNFAVSEKKLLTMNDRILNKIRQAGMNPDLPDLEKYRITRDKRLPDMDFLFRIFGKPCFPRGELIAVTGKAKSGKTLFTSMLMACCVKDEVLQVQRPFTDVDGSWRCPPLRCLWYDTEQSEQSTQDILKNRILRLVVQGATSVSSVQSVVEQQSVSSVQSVVEQQFDVFNVRCLHYEERLRLFDAAVRHYQPDLVLLDGVRDLLADINDGIKAQEIVEHLMQLAQTTACSLVCVLHQNKGAEDRNPRGWIGTELMNKAFEVYSCEKAKPENIFVVEQTLTRKYDLGQLLFFRMDDDSELPVVCEAPTRYAIAGGYLSADTPSDGKLPYMNKEWLTFDENNKPHPKSEALFYEALKAGPLFYSDLQGRVMQLLNCGTQMWNNIFCEMRDKAFIVRSKTPDRKTVWMLPKAQTAQPRQPDMFDTPAADSGASPSS